MSEVTDARRGAVARFLYDRELRREGVGHLATDERWERVRWSGMADSWFTFADEVLGVVNAC